jgi:hypothetical protein
MGQAGMIHQAVRDHFDVSRITISRLMIRLRQTGRTNDRLWNDRPCVSFPEFLRNGTGCYCLFCEDKRVSRKH